jgi:hypothetical protein
MIWGHGCLLLVLKTWVPWFWNHLFTGWHVLDKVSHVNILQGYCGRGIAGGYQPLPHDTHRQCACSLHTVVLMSRACYFFRCCLLDPHWGQISTLEKLHCSISCHVWLVLTVVTSQSPDHSPAYHASLSPKAQSNRWLCLPLGNWVKSAWLLTPQLVQVACWPLVTPLVSSAVRLSATDPKSGKVTTSGNIRAQ